MVIDYDEEIKMEEKELKHWMKKKDKYKSKKSKDMCEIYIQWGIKEIEKLKQLKDTIRNQADK